MRLFVATVAAVSCGEKALLLKVAQRGLASVYRNIDATATSAVTTVRPSARDMRLASHRRGAITPSPSGEMEIYNVKKHAPYGRNRAGL
jgi:hypothetical protein